MPFVFKINKYICIRDFFFFFSHRHCCFILSSFENINFKEKHMSTLEFPVSCINNREKNEKNKTEMFILFSILAKTDEDANLSFFEVLLKILDDVRHQILD